jgi:VCBS repeat-containing protein
MQAVDPSFRIGARSPAIKPVGYGRHIGRVSALAVALGFGAAVATGFGTGVARAEEPGTNEQPSLDAPSDPSPTAAGDLGAEQAPEGGSNDADPDGTDDGTPDADVDVDSSGGQDTSDNDDGQSTDNAVDDEDEGDDNVDDDQDVVDETDDADDSEKELTTPEDPTESQDRGTQRNSLAAPTLITPSSNPPAGGSNDDDGAGSATLSASTAGRPQARLLLAPGSAATKAVQLSNAGADTTSLTTLADTSAAQVQDEAMALPGAVVNIVSTLVAAFLSPFLAPGPSAPAEPPLLWAVLAFVRREISRTFFNSTPVANDIHTSTDEDTPKIIDVIDDDTDADVDDTVTVTDVTQPANGEVVINDDGTVSYTPDGNFSGTDTFTYTLSDAESGPHLHGFFGFFGGGHADTASVTVTVNAANDAPVADNDAYSVDEDGTLIVPAATGALNGDTDVDGTPLTAEKVADAGHGTLTLDADGSFIYKPAANYSGPDSFTYRATDGVTLSNVATVNITVNPIDDPPVAGDDTASSPGGAPITIAVLSNDSDPESSPLTVSLVSEPSDGTVVLNSSGSFTYTPDDSGAAGTDSFTYKVNDGALDSNVATVTITVGTTPDNAEPKALNDTYDVDQGSVVTIAAPGVMSNDSDPENDPLTAELMSGAEHGVLNGTLTFNADGSFQYTPNAEFTGVDDFDYLVADGHGGSDTATVTINVNEVIPVNHDPVAGDDVFTVPQGGSFSVSAAQLLDNDVDDDGDALLPNIITADIEHGSFAVHADGSFDYTPNADFYGIEEFRYTVTDGKGGVDTGNITILVTGPASVANNDGYTLSLPGTIGENPPGVLTNDTAANGGALPEGSTVEVVDQPTGAASFTLFPSGAFTYVPAGGFTGTDTFTYKVVSDFTPDSAPATVTINVVAARAQIANDDSYATTLPGSLAVAVAEGVLANDTAPEGDDPTLPAGATAVLVQGPENATSFSLGSDGSFVYSPIQDFTGTDTFIYKINYGGTDSAPATVTITVNPPPAVTPLAKEDGFGFDLPTTELNVAAPGVLANDTYADGGALPAGSRAFLVTGPGHAATFTLNTDGSFVYVVEDGFDGTDSFTYVVNDGVVDSAPATVTIEVRLTG